MSETEQKTVEFYAGPLNQYKSFKSVDAAAKYLLGLGPLAYTGQRIAVQGVYMLVQVANGNHVCRRNHPKNAGCCPASFIVQQIMATETKRGHGTRTMLAWGRVGCTHLQCAYSKAGYALGNRLVKSHWWKQDPYDAGQFYSLCPTCQ